jgi:hypothetical protein
MNERPSFFPHILTYLSPEYCIHFGTYLSVRIISTKRNREMITWISNNNNSSRDIPRSPPSSA